MQYVLQDKLDQYFFKMHRTVPTQVDKFAWCIMLGCDYINKNMEYFTKWLSEKEEEHKLSRLKAACNGSDYYNKFLEVYQYFYSQPVFAITSLTDIESTNTNTTIAMEPLYLIKESETISPTQWLQKWKLILETYSLTHPLIRYSLPGSVMNSIL